MKVRKMNKIYTIAKEQKESYLKQGFDVIDDKTGKVVESSPVSKMTYAEHKKLVAEKDAKIEELEATVAEKDAKIEELKKAESVPDFSKPISRWGTAEWRAKATEFNIEFNEKTTNKELAELLTPFLEK